MLAREAELLGDGVLAEPVDQLAAADLELLRVKPDCGCSIARFEKVIKPGAEAVSEALVNYSDHFPSQPGIDQLTPRGRLIEQFRASPEGALAEEVRTTVNNLGGLPGAISWPMITSSVMESR